VDTSHDSANQRVPGRLHAKVGDEVFAAITSSNELATDPGITPAFTQQQTE